VGDPESGNLLALKALLPKYAGKVKCVYIDPPYNTGNEKWVYNDNVNSPEIKTWCTSCRVGAERLKQEKITFCQIPYELKVQ
jgi:16S rRNA G966 N2-methylase RsmD